jgi:hypothetical protein
VNTLIGYVFLPTAWPMGLVARRSDGVRAYVFVSQGKLFAIYFPITCSAFAQGHVAPQHGS